MIGELGQMLWQFVQSNPGLVSHACVVAAKETGISHVVDDIETGISDVITGDSPEKRAKREKVRIQEEQRKREEEQRKKEEEAIAQHKAEIYDFAVRCEVESLTEADERYKKYDADVLREFAEKRLLENLPARIESWNGEIAEMSNEIDSENAVVQNLQEQLTAQKQGEKDFEDAMNEYQDRCNEANRLHCHPMIKIF